jgi:hypothetical protein
MDASIKNIDFKYGTYLSSGADSTVYLSKDELTVIKVYNKLLRDYGMNKSEDCLNLIRRYNADTIKASKNIKLE